MIRFRNFEAMADCSMGNSWACDLHLWTTVYVWWSLTFSVVMMRSTDADLLYRYFYSDGFVLLLLTLYLRMSLS